MGELAKVFLRYLDLNQAVAVGFMTLMQDSPQLEQPGPQTA